MSTLPVLKLPTTYEELREEVGDDGAQMMRFVVPVEDAEKELAEIATTIGKAGRVVLLFGQPGSGKSTFVRSLEWRRHVPIREIKNIDTSAFGRTTLLNDILEQIAAMGTRSIEYREFGLTAVVLDYLENLSGQKQDEIKGFFRYLNGILRKFPVLIIWPITNKADVEVMLEHSRDVSGTIFHPGKPVLTFTGPDPSTFPKIAKDTIPVLNGGSLPSDFQLTDEDFSDLLVQLRLQSPAALTARSFLDAVKHRWSERTSYFDEIRRKMPKPFEVWFVFSYPQAESVVSQFVRKGLSSDDAWDALHAKLSEYIHKSSQRAADWREPLRLQMALSGSFKTKILFLPTNALVSCAAAFGDQYSVNQVVDLDGVPDRWYKESTAIGFLGSSPLIRQLKGEPVKLGMRRSGPGAGAIDTAGPVFAKITAAASGSGPGSDERFNSCLADGIAKCLGVPRSEVVTESEHPWLPGIIPDIRVDTNPGKHVCIEMSYTNKNDPYVVADYVLRKLDRYLRQLEAVLKT